MSGSSVPDHYMWFEASASLRHNAETFIQNIHRGERSPQNDLLQRVLEEFVSQCLEVYFLAPMERAGLGPMGHKIVVTAVATLRKTIQMVVGRIVRKLSHRDMRPLAEFMDRAMTRNHAGAQGVTYVVFPLEPETVHEFLRMQLHVRSTEPAAPAAVAEGFQRIADEAVTYLFAEPVEALRLGPVRGKLSLMAIDSTRSVISGLIRRIFTTMTPQQVSDTLDYFCQHIATAEQLGVIAQPQREWA